MKSAGPLHSVIQAFFLAGVLALVPGLGAEEDYFTQALQAAQGEKFTEAITLFDKAFEQDPEDALALYQRAALKINHLGEDSYDDVLEDLAKTLRLRPKMISPRVDRANILMRQGKPEEALASLDEVLQIHPGAVYAMRVQGMILESLNRKEEAISVYGRLIESDPGDLHYYRMRGDLLASMAKYKEAIADYDVSTEGVNGNSPVQDQALILKRGRVYLSLRQPAAAFEDFSRYAEWNPESYEGWQGKAFASLALKKPKEHLENLNQWLRLNPGHPVALKYRARAKYYQKQHADALEDAMTLAKRANPQGDHLVLASWLLSSVPKDELRNGKQALELADKAMGSKQVSGGWVREARAAALAETGDMEGAAKQQEDAIATYQKEFKDQVERLEHSVSCAEKRLKSYREGKPNRHICRAGS